MRKTIISLLGVCFLLAAQISFGQEISVSDPILELRGNIVHISYDILNSTSSEKFSVELRITDARGKKINATALSGDIGNMVPGGDGKSIAWDLKADNIEMDGSIFVDIFAKAMLSAAPVVVPRVKKAPKDDPVEAIKEEELQETREKASSQVQSPSRADKKQFSHTGLLIQSAVFPGLGLTRYKGGPHWVKGVAAYGCIAGSVVLNRKSISTYSGIIDLVSLDEKTALYQKSVSQGNISEALVYAAIGIWITDLVWTFIGTSDMKQTAAESEGIRINSTIDPVSSTPMIAFTYKF